MVSAFVTGIFACLLYKQTKSIVPAILLHILTNVIAFQCKKRYHDDTSFSIHTFRLLIALLSISRNLYILINNIQNKPHVVKYN